MSDTCPSCGEFVKASNTFCGICGFDLREVRQGASPPSGSGDVSPPPKPPSEAPPPAGRVRKSTVLGLPSVVPGASKHVAAPSPPSSRPPPRRAPKKTMFGMPLAGGDSEAPPPQTSNPVDAHGDTAAMSRSSVLSDIRPAPAAPGNDQQATGSARPRANVRYGSGFESIPVSESRRRAFVVWGGVLVLSLGWLAYRALQAHG